MPMVSLGHGQWYCSSTDSSLLQRVVSRCILSVRFIQLAITFLHFAHRLYCRHVYRTAYSNKHIKVFLYNSSPLGLWQPVYQLIKIENHSFAKNKDFKLDMFNVVVGVMGQCCLALLPMYLILWSKLPLMLVVITLIIITLILKNLVEPVGRLMLMIIE